MLHSFAQYPATQKLPGSHLDEFFDRPNPASLKYVRPKNLPICGQKSITADMRSTVLTGRPASVRQSLISQPLTLITPWHLPCSLDGVVRKLEIQSLKSNRLREEEEVTNHERHSSKTDKL
jgi:hypothetical protein